MENPKKKSGLGREVSAIFGKRGDSRENAIPSFFRKSSPLTSFRGCLRRARARIIAALEKTVVPIGGVGAVTGLDIGKSSIRVVQVFQRFRSIRLLSLAKEEIPAKSTGFERERFIENALKKILGKVKKGKVVSSIYSPHIQTRVVKLPPTPPEKLRESLRAILKRQLPSGLEGKVIDYAEIKGTRGKKLPQPVVQTVISPASLIEEREALLKKFDLSLIAIETAPFALARLFQSRDHTAVLNIGAQTSSLNIICEGALLFSRNLPFGGGILTEAIMQALEQQDYNKAERLKREHGVSGGEDEKIYRALLPPLERFVRDIRFSLEYYHRQASIGPSTIGRLILSGGGSRLKGLAAFLAENLKMTVEQMTEVPVGLKIGGELRSSPLLEELCSSFLTGIGLALRKNEWAAKSVNLALEKKSPFFRVKWREQLPKLTAPAVAFLTLVFCLLDYIPGALEAESHRREMEAKEKALAFAEARGAVLKEKQEEVSREITKWAEIWDKKREKLASLKGAAKKAVMFSDVLMELGSLTPGDVWLRSFTPEKDLLKITGSSLSNDSVGKFMTCLIESVFFDEVSFLSSERNEEEKVVNFEIVCKINHVGKKAKND